MLYCLDVHCATGQMSLPNYDELRNDDKCNIVFFKDVGYRDTNNDLHLNSPLQIISISCLTSSHNVVISQHYQIII